MSKEAGKRWLGLWAARDKDGSLWVYFFDKPKKGHTCWEVDGIDVQEIDRSLLPSVKWEDAEPTEIDLKILNEKA